MQEQTLSPEGREFLEQCLARQCQVPLCQNDRAVGPVCHSHTDD